jgi:hypothetical protein
MTNALKFSKAKIASPCLISILTTAGIRL